MESETAAKRRAGERAADMVTDGMVVGLGTGSTVYWTLQRLGERVRDGLRIRGIPTSRRTEELALGLGISLTSFADVGELDLTIDGADEIDPKLDLVKGGGGALLREKIVAAASRRLIVVADESKLVPVLGVRPLPVEVVPFGHQVTARRITALGCLPTLRLVDGQPFVTDNGNHILDCAFGAIPDPARLQRELKLLTGVVETGLFVGVATLAVIGTNDGIDLLTRPGSASAPRGPGQRIADVREKLRQEVDCWVASASATGEAYLIPLSFVWDGTRITLAMARASRTVRQLQRAGWARLAWGPTRDVVILEGPVTIIPRAAVDPALAEAFATATGFDPRRLPAEPEYVYLSVIPQRIQAWREENELAGREIMTSGVWRV